MVIPTRSYGWLWLFLAASAAWAPGAGALAGDAPRQEAASRLDAPALAGLIDKSIQDRLSAEKATVAPLADDAEFVRRAYLDITGVIPPADKVAAFLDSKQPDKRARLIDALLASPNYGLHMGDLWQEQLLAQQDLLTRGLQLDPLASYGIALARTRYWYARMLLSCGGPGDRPRAADLLTRTVEAADGLGMAGLAAAGRALASTATDGTSPA